jgi:6-phosphogluconate dehydrogenase
VAWNRTTEVGEQFRIQNSEFKNELTIAQSIEELINDLPRPKIIWVMLPAGDPTDDALTEVVKYTKKGDIVIDGANSFYKDTQRRYEALSSKGIRFLGIGVSGGIKAGEAGYPLMIGGDRSAYEEILPLLETLIKPGGSHEYFGEGGAGHFVKMVHNGIEYGMMQAIGEGFGVLEKAPYTIDLKKVSELWQKNTIITSFLMECAKDALAKDVHLSKIDGVIDATGEAEWTVTQANEEGVFAENIEQSLDFRRRSKTDSKVSSSFAARMVAALRHEFGGHKVKSK